MGKSGSFQKSEDLIKTPSSRVLILRAPRKWTPNSQKQPSHLTVSVWLGAILRWSSPSSSASPQQPGRLICACTPDSPHISSWAPSPAVCLNLKCARQPAPSWGPAPGKAKCKFGKTTANASFRGSRAAHAETCCGRRRLVAES